MGCNATPTRNSGLINNRINLQEKDDYPYKGEALQSADLYREVKAIFAAVANGLQTREPAQDARRRSPGV